MFSAGQSDPGLPNAGTGQPAAALPAAAPAAPAPAPAKEDPWAEAEAAYNADPTGLPDPFALPDAPPGTQPPGEQPATTDAPAAALPDAKPAEGDKDFKGVNLYSPEGLDTPEKVAERLKAIQGYETKKFQESGKVAEAHQNLVSLVAQVAADPSKLPMFLRTYGPELEKAGIPVNFEWLNGQKPPEGDAPKPATAAEARAARISQAVDSIKSATTDEELGQKIGELVWQTEENALRTIHALLPVIDERINKAVGPVVQRDREVSRSNMWDSAATRLASDKNLDGFMIAVTPPKDQAGNPVTDERGQPKASPLQEFIANDPMLLNWAIAINKNPEQAAKQGVTTEVLLRKAYELFSGPQRIEAATKKAREEALNKAKGQPEQPGTHTATIPADGMSWDQIEKEVGDPWRPA